MHPEFLNENIMALFEAEVKNEGKDKWVVWFDGVSNGLGHGIGECWFRRTNNVCLSRLGYASNVQTSYKACALGIPTAINFRVKLLKVYRDSALVIHQLKGEWETRDHKLVPYQASIKGLMELFDDISFHHIPREEN